MDGIEARIAWNADGEPLELGITRYGEGPTLLMLPALSSISTRRELWGLQQCLGRSFSTIAVDWPGFGDLSRPRVDWRPEHYREFIRFLASEFEPAATVAAGHGAGYCLGEAAHAHMARVVEAPQASQSSEDVTFDPAGSDGGFAADIAEDERTVHSDVAGLGRLVLLSPTWSGPLPTMAGKRMGLFASLARMVDLPGLGACFYRLNVNKTVIGMMARGHVYDDPAWLNEARMWEKRKVTEAPGARYASFRFVAGELDPFLDQRSFLAAGQRAGQPILLLYGQDAPPKTKAEMQLLASLDNIEGLELSTGKLSFYEEYPGVTGQAILSWLGVEQA